MVEIADRMADGESTPGHTSDPREAKGDTDHLSERGSPKGRRTWVTRQAGLKDHPRRRGWVSAIFWCITVFKVWATGDGSAASITSSDGDGASDCSGDEYACLQEPRKQGFCRKRFILGC